MSSNGESASPGVSFSPGFLGGILLPGLACGITAVSTFLGSALAVAAFALSFSSFALAANCALVSFSTLADFLWRSALAPGLAIGLADLTNLTDLAADFDNFAETDLTGVDLAGAFLAGAALEAA